MRNDTNRHLRRVERPLIFTSAFDNGLADRKSAFKRFNGNNQATSRPNLVNFRPIISEFTLLKRALFAAIRAQFDDDLHCVNTARQYGTTPIVTYWADDAVNFSRTELETPTS